MSSKRTSHRLSTYSAFAASPTFTHTRNSSTHQSTAAALETTGLSEIRHLTAGLDRLENKHLNQQRFVPSARKQEDLSKLALGAKVERALGRRMVDQDAVLKVKSKKEKTSVNAEKNTAKVKG